MVDQNPDEIAYTPADEYRDPYVDDPYRDSFKPEPESTDETPAQQSTPDASAPAPSPVTNESMQQAFTNALTNFSTPPQQQYTPPWETDPEKFMLIDPDLPDAVRARELVSRFDQMAQYRADQSMRQLQINQNELSARMIQQKYASEPAILQQAYGLVQTGKINDIDTAVQFVKLQSAAAPPASRKAPMKPVPRGTASSSRGQSRPTAPPTGPAMIRTDNPVRDLMRQDPEIRAALAKIPQF